MSGSRSQENGQAQRAYVAGDNAKLVCTSSVPQLPSLTCLYCVHGFSAPVPLSQSPCHWRQSLIPCTHIMSNRCWFILQRQKSACWTKQSPGDMEWGIIVCDLTIMSWKGTSNDAGAKIWNGFTSGTMIGPLDVDVRYATLPCRWWWYCNAGTGSAHIRWMAAAISCAAELTTLQTKVCKGEVHCHAKRAASATSWQHHPPSGCLALGRARCMCWSCLIRQACTCAGAVLWRCLLLLASYGLAGTNFICGGTL